MTNQFTDEQVEAAAEAIYFEDCGVTPDESIKATDDFGSTFREFARAALVAAASAAPQLIGRLDLARHYWRSQGYDYDLHGQDGNNDYEMGLAVADAALAALAAAQGAAPQAESEHEHLLKARALHQTNSGLPSSTVDEDALAEVIRRSYENEQGLKIRDDKRTARAVAEWLRGESR